MRLLRKIAGLSFAMERCARMSTKRNDKKLKNFIQVHRVVIANEQVSDGAFRLYCYLLDRKNSSNSLAWATQETIARDLGVTSKTVENRLKELYAAKLVIKEKMKNWPTTKNKVWGNRLMYKVHQAHEILSEDQLKFNWNKKKIAESSSEKLLAIKSEEFFGDLSKETKVIKQKQISGSIIEQERIGTISYKEQDDNNIKETLERLITNSSITLSEEIVEITEEELSLLELFDHLSLQANRNCRLEYSNRDLQNIRKSISMYSFNVVKDIIEYAFFNWSELTFKFNGLSESLFTLKTLTTGWADCILDDMNAQFMVYGTTNINTLKEKLKEKSVW